MQNSNKLLALDSLRGIAAFIVFFGHFVHLFCSANQTAFFENFLYFTINGTSSVYLFFMLSGFVLSYKFWLSYESKQLLFSTIIRYFRLLFIVSLCGFLAFFLAHLGLLFNPFDYSQKLFEPIHLTFKEICWQNLTVFFTGIHVDKVFWTMKIEYIGSILVFANIFLICRFCKNNKVRVCLLTFALIALVIFGSFVNNPLQMGVKFLSFFVSGMLTSFLYVNFFKISNTKYQKKSYPLFFFYLISFLLFFSKTPLINSSGLGFINKLFAFLDLCLYILLGSFLLIGALQITKITNILNFRLFLFMGKISFSFYAIHSLVFGSLNVFLFKYFSLSNNILAITSLFSIDLVVCIILSRYMTKLDKTWNIYMRNIYWLIVNKINSNKESL